MEYQNAAASRLLVITYRKPDNTVINSIAYSYDAKGPRTSNPYVSQQRRNPVHRHLRRG